MVTAVDAVGIFPSFTYVLLIVPRVTFCRNAMHKRLHPSLQGRRQIRASHEAETDIMRLWNSC
jgi:hypothetical protein